MQDARSRLGRWIGLGACIRGEHSTVILDDSCSAEDSCVIPACPGEQMTVGNWIAFGHGAVVHNVMMIHDCAIIGMGLWCSTGQATANGRSWAKGL